MAEQEPELSHSVRIPIWKHMLRYGEGYPIFDPAMPQAYIF